MQTQHRLRLNGLHTKVEPFLTRHEITDIKAYSKLEWRNLVGCKIEMENREFLIDMASNYKKIDYLEMACEGDGIKDYFIRLDLNSTPMKFMARAQCMPTCMEHYPSKQENIDARFLCLCKEGKVDNLIHWRECRLYSSLKETDMLRSDVELTKFYSQVIQMRANAV